MQQGTGRGVSGSVLIIMLVMAMLSPSAILAEQSASDATAEPPPPTEITPTPVMDAPIIPPPTEPGVDLIEAEATAQTSSDDADMESVDSGTSDPSATSTPEPTALITWSQTEPVSCHLSDGEATGIAYAESQTWRCTAAAEVPGDIALPDDVAFNWMVSVTFPDSHALSIPAESQAQVASQDAEGDATHYVIAQSGMAQQLVFDVKVSRTTCAIGEQLLTIQATPEIDAGTSGEEIVQVGDSGPVASYVADFLPNLASPDVSMSAVDFGVLKWDGKSWGSSRAVSTITVSNPGPCATSQAHTVELRINADDAGMQPTLVSVDASGSVITVIDGGGTSIATIPAGFSGSETIEVEFELAPSVDSHAGNHTFGFEVTVTAVPYRERSVHA